MSRRARQVFRTKFWIRDRTLILDLGATRTVLSSAARGGGLVRARYVLNHQVPANPLAAPVSTQRWGDPARALHRIAASLGVAPRFVGLMTAVPLRNLATVREESDGVWVEGFLTVGVTNAVRAGEPAPAGTARSAARRHGTINIILVTNARLSHAAMVTAVQVAAESKASVLLRQRVRSSVSRTLATGTGTDATVIVRGSGPARRYSGTHTPVGAMIGRVVARAVARGLAHDASWRGGRRSAAPRPKSQKSSP